MCGFRVGCSRAQTLSVVGMHCLACSKPFVPSLVRTFRGGVGRPDEMPKSCGQSEHLAPGGRSVTGGIAASYREALVLAHEVLPRFLTSSESLCQPGELTKTELGGPKGLGEEIHVGPLTPLRFPS